jgi:diguanylate cyclase
MARGLCFCDVDNFKSINDQFGHATGDAVLKTVAESLKESLRQGDLVGRYGGDEFLIVLRGCSTEGLHEVCRRIQEHVSLRLQTSHAELGVSCSISIGYAVQSDKGPFNSSSSWLESADQALYEAKRTGKNQVVGCIVPSEHRAGGAGACAE